MVWNFKEFKAKAAPGSGCREFYGYTLQEKGAALADSGFLRGAAGGASSPSAGEKLVRCAGRRHGVGVQRESVRDAAPRRRRWWRRSGGWCIAWSRRRETNERGGSR